MRCRALHLFLPAARCGCVHECVVFCAGLIMLKCVQTPPNTTLVTNPHIFNTLATQQASKVTRCAHTHSRAAIQGCLNLGPPYTQFLWCHVKKNTTKTYNIHICGEAVLALFWLSHSSYGWVWVSPLGTPLLLSDCRDTCDAFDLAAALRRRK